MLETIRKFKRTHSPRRAWGRLLGLLSTAVLVATAWGGLASPVSSDLTDGHASTQRITINDSVMGPPKGGGSEQYIKFERISLEQGLSQISVHCIIQDSQGFMWFGTQDGLNKYNGYDFEVYKPIPGDPHSLSDNYITVLYQDSSGMLWIGTENGGINKFDRETGQFTHYVYNPYDPYSLSNNTIRAIYEDRDGVLWVGTEGGGLNKFSQEIEIFTRYQTDSKNPYSLSNNTVRAIHQDQEGVLWVGTDDGLNRFDSQKEEFSHYKTNPDDPYSLSSNAIEVIYQDQSGMLWIGTLGGGLNKLERATGRFIRYRTNYNSYSLSNNYVRVIYQDREGALWVGTDAGLNQFDRKNERFVRYYHDVTDSHSLSNDNIRSIYEDESGVLWIGTSGGGINKFDRATERFAHYKADFFSGLSSNFVRAFYQDPDDENVLWIGSTGGGLDRFDREKGGITTYKPNVHTIYSISDDTINSICADQTGDLWIGTENGLNRFDRSTGYFTSYQHDPDDPHSLSDNTVLTVYQDREGVLWVGTRHGGLNRFDPVTEQFTHYQHDPRNPFSLSSNTVKVIYQDWSDALWIGTWDGGLNRFDQATERFVHYYSNPENPAGLSDDTILSIHEDQAGIFWLGTHSGGLNKFNRETGIFTHYREQDGLPNDVVYGILEDERGYLWLSTNKGLSRFDPQTERFINYDVSDGLQSNEFNEGAYYKSPTSGEMFFGGINGFNAFYPASIKSNPYVPPVVLTSLTQGGEDVVAQALESVPKVTFRWPHNFFEFEFAALSYRQPEKNQYAYKLEGFEDDWIYAGTRRFGRYTNLPGKTYTLRIKASNSDGVWNEEGAAIEIRVVPPFWATWWFRGIAALALAGSVIGTYWLRVKNVEMRSRELETRIAQRTAELRQEIDQRMQIEEALRQSEMEKAVAAERSRLARDLHDAVTQTLFSASLIAGALPTSWERDQEEGRQLLKELGQLTQGVMAEMRTLLLELRPTALVESSLGNLLRQLAEAATAREGIPVTVTVEGERALPSDVHVALYRLAQESLNNVSKHARANRVTISLRCPPPHPANNPDTSISQDGQDQAVELCVWDDGRGFDPDQVATGRMGLNIMRERVQAIGATLAIESQQGDGTKITVLWQEDEGRRTGDEKGQGKANAF